MENIQTNTKTNEGETKCKYKQIPTEILDWSSYAMRFDTSVFSLQKKKKKIQIFVMPIDHNAIFFNKSSP